MPPLKRPTPIAAALNEVLSVLKAHHEDYKSGLADGTYDDKEGFAKLELTLARFEAMKPTMIALYNSSVEMLDAYGGDVPDWLREEAIKVENAYIDLKKAAMLEVEPDVAPAPIPGP